MRTHDLYYLKHLRTSFSDHDIASIANKILETLEYLHSHGIIYKYLSPKHIKVTKGCDLLNQEIQISIKDLVIM